jgi:1-deoxyxylulose-5-phosphate synthase
MRKVKLGKTGLKVSPLAIGCMSFGGPESKGFEWTLGYGSSKKIIGKALDLGINFFDTADVYSGGRSEEIVGRALEGRRNDVVIATKVGLPTGDGPGDRGLGRKHVRANLKRSLEHLRTDHVDLYQVHRWDYGTPIADVMRTLNEALEEGRVDHLGGSSMWAWQFAKSLYTSDRLGLRRFETMQNHYNLAYREEEREMIPLCRDEGVAIIPWSPLARGFLSGKYKRKGRPDTVRYKKDRLMKERFFRPEDFDVVERLVEVAEAKGVKPSQVALAWLLSKEYVTAPIVGPTRVEQLEELAEAADLSLKGGEIRRIEEPYRPHPVLGHG